MITPQTPQTSAIKLNLIINVSAEFYFVHQKNRNKNKKDFLLRFKRFISLDVKGSKINCAIFFNG
jgi:hypothetical protein